mmetsp:Transcript_18744/g.35178  ORF Transcript_18744/g.35178 Transcript_18744/m.35178 type:complete len:250 (-) Transcript_18744:192-941(-)
MNYSHDTEMDRDWAADQLRRKKNALSGLPDSPIRRTAASLPEVAVAAVQGAAATPPGEATLGSALSALAINAGSAEHVQRICHGLLSLLYDKECLEVHQEFAQLKGVEALLAILRRHGSGTALAALRVLEKLCRTVPRELCSAGGVDVLTRCAEVPCQAPRLLEASLRCLHGLTFDGEAKAAVARRGVRDIAESLIEDIPLRKERQVVSSNDEQHALDEAWDDTTVICKRLLQRLNDGKKKTGKGATRS